MSRKILGLDIQNNAVSAVLISSGIKGAVIEAHDYVPFSTQGDHENELAVALEMVAKKIDVFGSVCVASFPADWISYRNLKLPFKGKKKISKILPYELEPTLPLPVDDLIIDFHVIKRAEHTDHTDIIAAAVDKSELQSYLDNLSTFHIDPEIVTVQSYPAALCIANLIDGSKKWLFIDLDNTRATMFVGTSGNIRLMRSFAISSNDIPSSAERFCTNVYQTLSAFGDELGFDFQPDEILISGSGLDVPDFENHLATSLEVPIKRINLVRDTDVIKQHPLEQSWIPHKNDGAFALALMEIQGNYGLNFRKGPFAPKKFWQEHKKSLIKTGILAAVVIALAFTNLVLDSYLMNKKFNRLNRQIEDTFTSIFPDVKKIVDPLQQMKIKMQAARRNALLPGATDRSIRTIDILRDISRLTPKEVDVNLTRLVVSMDSVVISGNTDTYKSVDGIKSSLEQADFFKKIVISSANIDKSDNRVRFKLKIDL
ncbi:MAG: pilus assembly protein PilM [Desulfobacterales bacterium]|nr:MAG: pilus assembly protein PilM [Desulfobacterales bacterium]